MELGDDLVELLLGVLGIGGEFGGDVAQDCELLGELYGNTDECAIGAEELIDLLGHLRSLSDNLSEWNTLSMKKTKMFWSIGIPLTLTGAPPKMY